MGRKERREAAKRIANEWAPPRLGPKQDDEVSCFAFGIPNIPISNNPKIVRLIEYIKGLEGFVGLYPFYPHGTLLIFDTENNAKGGRNLIRAYSELPVETSKEIGEVFINKKYLKG